MQQGSRFYIVLELTCLFDAHCYEFPDRKSYDGFVPPVERELIFKNLLFDLLTMARSFKNLFYLSSCSLPQRRFHRIRSHVLQGIESDLACTKVSGIVYQYILRFGSLWYPRSSNMLMNKQMTLSMTLQLGLASNHII